MSLIWVTFCSGQHYHAVIVSSKSWCKFVVVKSMWLLSKRYLIFLIYDNDSDTLTTIWNTSLTHLPQCRIWVSIGSGNGLSPVRRQAITWTNAELISIVTLGTNFREIRIKNTKCFAFMQCGWKYPLRKGIHFVQALLLSNQISLIHGLRVK